MSKKHYSEEKRAGLKKHKMYPLAKNLRAERARLGLTGEEIAQKADMDKQTLNKLENGNFVFVDPEVLLRLAAIYETTPNDLLGAVPKGGIITKSL